MTRLPVVIVDAKGALAETLIGVLVRLGCRQRPVPERWGRGALRRDAEPRADLVVTAATPEGEAAALERVERVRRLEPTLPIIFVAARSSEELVVAALRAGVTDYLRWPFAPPALAASLERCLGPAPVAPGAVDAAGARDDDPDATRLIGASRRMREIRAYLAQVATTDANVLITGETGTGKELAAELIHARSARASRPFVSINCAALPEGLLESELFGYERGAFTGAHARRQGKLELAGGGTVFFDEIGDMSPHAQAKILRAIESRAVHRLGGNGGTALDIRVIAATNRDLERAVSEGNFRQDLYFRLNVARVHLPPLRERPGDLPALIRHYVAEFNRRLGVTATGFTDEALEQLLTYEWPGNVRELRNVIEATFVTRPQGHISLDHLPEPFRRRLSPGRRPHEERDELLSALIASRWNKSKAAERLNWSRMTLYRKLAKYRIVRSDVISGESRATAS
jgi:DNA-binding NtrC family response regulator